MNEIVEILMRRDGISRREAIAWVKDVQEMINEVIAEDSNSYIQYEEVCDILRDELGLEPDYLDAFLI